MLRAVFLVAALITAAPVLGQVDWLPPEMEQGAAGSLVVRLAEVGVDMPGTNEEKADASLELIRGMTARIDSWGIDGVIERAPVLAQIERPDFGDPLIGTIASYGLCALMLHPEVADSHDERVTAVLGEYFIMLVSAYLRDWFLDVGGNDQELKEKLASPEMNQLSFDIQTDPERLGYVMTECGPMFVALFAP